MHSPNNASPKKILIIGPSWVGDMVMAQSLFILIKQQNTNTQIDVLAPAWSRPIIERMPEVSTAIDMPVGHGQLSLQTRKNIGLSLRQYRYQQAIVLPNSWKSALIPWFANIPIRTGWLGEMRYFLLNDPRKLNKKHYPLMVQRFTALAETTDKTPFSNAPLPLEQCPPPALHSTAANQQKAIKQLALNTDKPVIVLCPGAEFGPAKQWPAEHYATVANECLAQNWQVWIMGSSADQAIAKSIVEIIGAGDNSSVVNLSGQTSLAEAIDLIAVARQVISNDSGLMHIASALNKPVIALYGATSPNFTPPLSKSADVITSDIECSPCFKRTCPLGHHRCMKDLTPERVLNAIDL